MSIGKPIFQPWYLLILVLELSCLLAENYLFGSELFEKLHGAS